MYDKIISCCIWYLYSYLFLIFFFFSQQALRKEKDSLQIMLQTREKRSEAEGQEAPPPANGEVADHTDSAPKEDTILLKEHNNM